MSSSHPQTGPPVEPAERLRRVGLAELKSLEQDVDHLLVVLRHLTSQMVEVRSIGLIAHGDQGANQFAFLTLQWFVHNAARVFATGEVVDPTLGDSDAQAGRVVANQTEKGIA